MGWGGADVWFVHPYINENLQYFGFSFKVPLK